MQKKDCFYLGRIVKKHGLKGDVAIKLDTDEPEIYNKLESVFLEIQGILVPFFITHSKPLPNGNLVWSIEDFDLEQAEKSIGISVYLPLSLLPKLDDSKFYYHEIINYKVIDSVKGEIGIIKAINDTSAQALLEVEYQNKIVYIPIHDDFILKTDKLNKTILVKIPDGLLELYI